MRHLLGRPTRCCYYSSKHHTSHDCNYASDPSQDHNNSRMKRTAAGRPCVNFLIELGEQVPLQPMQVCPYLHHLLRGTCHVWLSTCRPTPKFSRPNYKLKKQSTTEKAWTAFEKDIELNDWFVCMINLISYWWHCTSAKQVWPPTHKSVVLTCMHKLAIDVVTNV